MSAAPTASSKKLRPRIAPSVVLKGGVLKNLPFVLAVLWLLGVAAFGLVPALTQGALDQNLMLTAAAPGTEGHIWGTDSLGRDVFAMTLAGAKTAIVGPAIIALGAMAVGLILGLSSAYIGGACDWFVSRLVELMLSLPSLLLAIVVAGVLGGSYWTNVLVFVILYAPFETRLVRSAALQHIHDPYLEAARLLELRPTRILFRHLLPIIKPVVISALFLDMSNALVSLSSLSFLGIGISPQEADWGRQLADARTLLYANPLGAIAPALAIIITAIALNVVGDWIIARGEGDAQ